MAGLIAAMFPLAAASSQTLALLTIIALIAKPCQATTSTTFDFNGRGPSVRPSPVTTTDPGSSASTKPFLGDSDVVSVSVPPQPTTDPTQPRNNDAIITAEGDDIVIMSRGRVLVNRRDVGGFLDYLVATTNSLKHRLDDAHALLNDNEGWCGPRYRSSKTSTASSSTDDSHSNCPEGRFACSFFDLSAAKALSDVAVVGGRQPGPHAPHQRAILTYDACQRSWYQASPLLPDQMFGLAATALGDGRLLVGPSSNGGSRTVSSNATYLVDAASSPAVLEGPQEPEVNLNLVSIDNVTFGVTFDHLKMFRLVHDSSTPRGLAWQHDIDLALATETQPPSEVGAALTSVPGRNSVAVLGGYNLTEKAVLATCVVFSREDGVIRNLPSLPSPRQYAAAASFGGAIVVAGGTDATGAYFDAVDVLTSLEADSWQPLAPLQYARSHLALAYSAGYLLAVGGRDASGTMDAVEALQAVETVQSAVTGSQAVDMQWLLTRKWQVLDSMPHGRMDAAVVVGA